jgi:AraC family L-rhamnose operon transcriptional activator RhaR/AraC family L-rhamnose operon regulatory protein RhaS
MHTHDFHEITIVFSGNGVFLTSCGSYEIQGGDVLSIKPWQPHGYQNIQNLTLMHILVHPGFFTGNQQYNFQSMPEFHTLLGKDDASPSHEQAAAPILRFALDARCFSEIWSIIESVSHELRDQPPGYEIRSHAQFLEFLVLLLRYYSLKNQEDDAAQSSQRLIEFARNNFREDITLESLSAFSRMSVRQIQRHFKRGTGTSAWAYVNSLRIGAACMDLKATAKPVTSIAFDSGFHDSNYFSRCFKNATGLSPQDYRARYGAGKVGAPLS